MIHKHHKIWSIYPAKEDLQHEISRQTGISPLIAQICINRGLISHQQVREMLARSTACIHDPFLFKSMHRAVNRIETALKKGEKILIYGDYDVDGITGTALLMRYLKNRQAFVQYYIPDRQEEGYGLNIEAIEKAFQQGISLIITVDCGISAVKETTVANGLGIDIIITDHHQPPADLPPAFTIINPKIPDSGYPFSALAGVGVAWKLVQALHINSGLAQNHGIVLAEYLDLVALGTIADVVPLIGENRVIVHYGLEKMSTKCLPGLRALMTVTGLDQTKISPGHVGFTIAPRLNAAGRLASANLGVALLMCDEYDQALALASQLDHENALRQIVEGTIQREAEEMINNTMDLNDTSVMVLSNAGWHPGVIGIVASTLAEKFYRPVILLASDGRIAKGSARSIPGFDMYQALTQCSCYLEKFGGHQHAAGLSLDPEKISVFRENINLYAKAHFLPELYIPRIKIDAELNVTGQEKSLVRQIDLLSPFGQGNPTPTFAVRRVKVSGLRSVGKNTDHLKLQVAVGGYFIDAIGFRMGAHLSWLQKEPLVDLAVGLEINTWNNKEKVQFVLKDIQPYPAQLDYQGNKE